ncbi:MAG: cation-transporting ATPase, partial [Roseomonas sp.]|nr:cation-transporting ATPase [Roseomonas sp.]
VLAAPYHHTAAEVAAALGTDPQAGLGAAAVMRQRATHGHNRLAAAPPPATWRRVAVQFRSTLVVLLLIAAMVSAGLWLLDRQTPAPYEAIAILAVVLLNAAMGYWQQARAEQAVAALQRMAAPHATVLRDGTRVSIDVTELVPGDLMLVEEGGSVSADARLLRASGLQMAEAALTGESLPVMKDPAAIAGEAAVGDQANMLFSGTSATQGHGVAVVTATGMATELGRIATLLQAAPQAATPLQRELDRTGRLIGYIVIAIAVVMIGVILLAQPAQDLRGIVAVFILAVALAVAAVPEGLPTVVTAVLSIGVQRMARRHAIVRRLAAVETLGSATVIASDKTGTLTRNEMTVRRIVLAGGAVEIGGSGYGPDGEFGVATGGVLDTALREDTHRLLTAASRASNATLSEQDGQWRVQGDPTEGALLAAAGKAGLGAAVLAGRFQRLAEVPFTSERKLMTVVDAEIDGAAPAVAFTKGAPEILLACCTLEWAGGATRPLTEARRAAILAANAMLAGQALRSLGIACRPLPQGFAPGQPVNASMEQELTFLGLVGMIDPPREEARTAVALARQAGIRPVMITGDHPLTAARIAAELGIVGTGRVLTGADLQAMSDTALDQAVPGVSVFARVSPEHKLRIVQALQRGGETVAMTGDGVNDAPALKAADIGIAMGITGTDVSKAAADIVLADDNFASIVAAVEQGRAIFANIRKFLRYLLSSNIGEVMTMFLGVLLAGVIGLQGPADGGLTLPLLATQILWINLVTDGAPALALGLDPAGAGVMARPPRPKGESVITPAMWRGIMLVGAIMAVGTLLVLDASLPGGLIEGKGDLTHGRTMAFATLALFQLFNVFNARSDHESAFRGLFSNLWLWGAVLLSFGLSAVAIYLPFMQQAFSTSSLSGSDWLLCTGVASSVLWLREAGKLWSRRGPQSAAAPPPGNEQTKGHGHA